MCVCAAARKSSNKQRAAQGKTIAKNTGKYKCRPSVLDQVKDQLAGLFAANPYPNDYETEVLDKLGLGMDKMQSVKDWYKTKRRSKTTAPKATTGS